MADEPIDLSLPITEEDLRSFLRAKGAERPCEACGCQQWATVVDTPLRASLGMPLLEVADGSSSIGGGGLNMLASVCNNCSNTRIFWRWTVARWKQEKMGSGK